MNFADYRKNKIASLERRDAQVRRPVLTTQEQRFLYGLRAKTMEHRTLLATLKTMLPPSKVDEIIVEYALRLKKARMNFEKNNYNHEWDLEDDE